MPHDTTVPKHLLHLLEKRQGPGRRKEDCAKPTTVAEKTAVATDRRKSNRRKSKPAKTRGPQ